MAMRVLVCGSCFEGLVALGAKPVEGKRDGSLLDRCDAHPSNLGVQATKLVATSAELVERWRKQEAPPAAPSSDLASATYTAGLAATLLGGKGLEATAADIEQAVTIARQLLAAAKGEAIR